MRNISCIFLKVIGKRTLKPYQLDIFTHDYNHNISLSDITFLCFISKCNRISGYLIRQANHFFNWMIIKNHWDPNMIDRDEIVLSIF